MATDFDFIGFVVSQIEGYDEVTFKKMFGEYMVYINSKPLLLVCDNTVFIKKLDCVLDIMKNAETGLPYNGAKPHFILDIENKELVNLVIKVLDENVAIPKKKNK